MTLRGVAGLDQSGDGTRTSVRRARRGASAAVRAPARAGGGEHGPPRLGRARGSRRAARTALAAVEEALRTIAPRFLAGPRALERETLVIAGNYRRQSGALAREPDASPIGPVGRVPVQLQRG